tara:strand:+ start:143362 stop:143730 length:369 start_codon:yes stop_codon:yes gene_type:complete
LTDGELKAWYVGKSHELLEDVKIPRYSKHEYKTEANSYEAAEELAKEALKRDLQEGKSTSNMTIALNGGTVHTTQTVRDVYLRLRKVKGDKRGTERQLLQMGAIFRNGEIPTADGSRSVPGY